MTVMQMSQADMIQQVTQLTQGLNQVMQELSETRRVQGIQQRAIKDMANTITKQYGVTCKIMKYINIYKQKT